MIIDASDLERKNCENTSMMCYLDKTSCSCYSTAAHFGVDMGFAAAAAAHLTEGSGGGSGGGGDGDDGDASQRILSAGSAAAMAGYGVMVLSDM